MAKSPLRPRDRAQDARAVLNALRRTIRAFRAAAQAAEETLGVSGAQHFVLEKLADAPSLSLNDLAARTMTHKSSVSVVVTRLVERGLVRRRRSTADGRSIVVTLTPAGERALARAPESAQSRMVAALRRLPTGDLSQFAGLFERFTDELGVGTLEPVMIFEEDGAGRRGRGHSGRSRGNTRAHAKTPVNRGGRR
jgi:MarR family transcriptional regulator, lower aerobic nicotinate degradation pathway regulator